jgi:uncharacterized protein YuzE
VSLRAGRYTFPYVTYDAPSDVLYASIQPQRSQGRRERTPEQHFLRYDDAGRFVGVTLVEPRSQLEREGAVYVSLPSGDRVRVSVAQLVELLVVVQVVAGSSPVAHPSRSPR